MNQIAASVRKKQAQSSETQKDQRTVWRHAQPWQFRTDGQGRKFRLVCWQERLLVKIIASYASKSGCCWASVKTLARKLGRSPAQTARYLARLRRQGIIVSKGLRHKHGTKVRTLDPSRLVSEPVKGKSRPSVNSYGLKKGMSYRPAYADARESESSTVRERESPTSANASDKYFLREVKGIDRELAVPQDAPQTCELPDTTINTSEERGEKQLEVDALHVLEIFDEADFLNPSGKESLIEDFSKPKEDPPSVEGQAQGSESLTSKPDFRNSATQYGNNLSLCIDREWTRPSEFLKYHPMVWGTHEQWKAGVEHWTHQWTCTCQFLGYTLDLNDPLLTCEFLEEAESEIIKRKHQDISLARLCMKVIDRCQRASPPIPFPFSFRKHKDKLYEAEKKGARLTPNLEAVRDLERACEK